MPLSSSSSSSSSSSPYGLASFFVAGCILQRQLLFPSKEIVQLCKVAQIRFPPFFLGKQPKSVRYNFYWPKRRETNLAWVSHQCCGLGLMPFSFFFQRYISVQEPPWGTKKGKEIMLLQFFFFFRLLGWCCFGKFLHHFLPVAVSGKWKEEEGQIEGIGEASLLFRHHPRKNVENSNRY